jgi:hypothetical protein
MFSASVLTFFTGWRLSHNCRLSTQLHSTPLSLLSPVPQFPTCPAYNISAWTAYKTQFLCCVRLYWRSLLLLYSIVAYRTGQKTEIPCRSRAAAWQRPSISLSPPSNGSTCNNIIRSLALYQDIFAEIQSNKTLYTLVHTVHTVGCFGAGYRKTVNVNNIILHSILSHCAF